MHLIVLFVLFQRNGFFVECGAFDGEGRSNTLALEKELGWTGLLIEADGENYEELVKKNRKAWTTNCCLSIHGFPHEVSSSCIYLRTQVLMPNLTTPLTTGYVCFKRQYESDGSGVPHSSLEYFASWHTET